MSELIEEKPSYKIGEVDTPYRRAYQEWDQRLGSARVQAKNWRLACLISLVVAFFLLVTVMMLVNKSNNVVYIAEVGHQGRVINVAPLVNHYTPSSAQYQYFISQFIQKTMSLPLDPVVAKQNWLQAYQFVVGRAKDQLTSYAQKSSPFKDLGKLTKTVRITQVQQITPNSYNAEWIQKLYNQAGSVVATNHYSAIFTVGHKTPTTENTIRVNPLGIVIEYFTLHQRN